MKDDPIIQALINFLIPTILLCGSFFFMRFFDDGFLAIVHSSAIFAGAAMIIFARNSVETQESKKRIFFQVVKPVIIALALIYSVAALFLLTDFLSI